MLFDLCLERQQAVQAAIQTRVVDLACFNMQQILQGGRRVPVLFYGQFAARIAQAIDREYCGYSRPRHIRVISVQVLDQELVQLQPLPQLQSQITVAEATRALHSYLLHQHARHIRIIRGFDFGGKQFQLRALAVFVEDLHRLLPPRMRRTVQLSQITKRALPRAIPGTHGLDQ